MGLRTYVWNGTSWVEQTSGSDNVVTSITGTSNQVTASAPNGAVTLSLPQSIATSSTPTFGGLTVGSSGISSTGNVTVGSGGMSLTAAGGHTDLMAALIATNTGQDLTATDASTSNIIAWNTTSSYGVTGKAPTATASGTGHYITVNMTGLYHICVSLRLLGGSGFGAISLWTGASGGSKVCENQTQNQTSTTKDIMTLNVYRYFNSGDIFRLTGFVQTTSASAEIVSDSTVNRLACVYLGAG